MADHKHMYTIEKMSQVFNVSRGGYYSWLRRGPSRRATERQKLKKRIKAIWQQSDRRYGSPRIHQQLLKQGWKTSRARVARLMRQMGIQSRIRRRWVVTTDSKHSLPVAPNLVERNFAPDRLASLWVSDITYIPCRGGWLYLTIILDLADRQILGWSLSASLKACHTVIPAWQMACRNRAISQELILHSDRGIQYACKEFTSLLKTNPLVVQSMSRKGDCWDNAPAESFFKTLKAELKMDSKFEDYQQARMAVFEFIEIWYNRRRLHSALGYKTPVEMQQLLTHNHAA